MVWCCEMLAMKFLEVHRDRKLVALNFLIGDWLELVKHQQANHSEHCEDEPQKNEDVSLKSFLPILIYDIICFYFYLISSQGKLGRFRFMHMLVYTNVSETATRPRSQWDVVVQTRPGYV
jgi:hypothetical protein